MTSFDFYVKLRQQQNAYDDVIFAYRSLPTWKRKQRKALLVEAQSYLDAIKALIRDDIHNRVAGP